jgi:KUP system potassium uptake protein
MAPTWALYPLVALATAATVIASQAVISGAFSLTMQAVQLGYMPRLEIDHTSERERGQIYIPSVNWALMIACIGLVLGFRSSSNLAAAYGVAVTTDMVFTTVLFAVVARSRFRWSIPAVIALGTTFLVADLAFWAANIIKVPHGGWFPLVIAAAVFILMTTWKRGREILAQRLKVGELPFEVFTESILRKPPVRVPGTAIFMYGNTATTPPALLHNLKHNKVLHERVVLLSILPQEVPTVAPEDRIETHELGHEFYQVLVRFGFMETPNVAEWLAASEPLKGLVKPAETTYYLGRQTLVPTGHSGMTTWRKKLFRFMARNAQRATAYFRLPPNRVVELGAQVRF